MFDDDSIFDIKCILIREMDIIYVENKIINDYPVDCLIRDCYTTAIGERYSKHNWVLRWVNGLSNDLITLLFD